MSLIQKIMYDVPGNFTFDTDQIEISDGKARLKLVDLASQQFSQDFASDTDFTYDSSKTEFVAGVVRQVDQRPASSIVAAKYDSSMDLNWSQGGSLTATLFGTPVLNGGKLECFGGIVNAVRYENAEIAAVGDTGTLRLRYTPNYSGTPSTNTNIAEFIAPSGNNDRLVFFHSSTGTVRVTAYSSTGVLIHSAVTLGAGAWSPVSGTEYELEFVWDTTTGLIRCFINGVLNGSATATVFTRDSAATRLYIGSGQVYPVGNAAFNDVILFTTVQHTSGYTPGYTIPDFSYAGDTITAPTFSYTGLGDIQEFSSASITDGNSPRYLLNDRYWNGSAWVVSNGTYAQAVSAATLIAEVDQLPPPVSNMVVLKVITQGQNLQASVSDFSMDYVGQIYPTTNPSIVNNAQVSADQLVNFSSLQETEGDDSISFILVVNNQDKYWDTGAEEWANSDGTLAQSSPEADILDNLDSLDLTGGANIKVKALLHSDDGSTTPEIEEVTLMYDFFVFTPASPTKCIIYSFLNDHVGLITDARTAILRIELKEAFKYGDRIIAPFRRTFVYNESGYLETTTAFMATADTSATDGIVETETVDLSPYFMSIQYRNLENKLVKVEKDNIQVPDQLTVNLAELFFPEVA